MSNDEFVVVIVARRSNFAIGSMASVIRKARLWIDDRLKRLASGSAGDTKSVGDGVQELRLHFGPGYRVYYMWRDGVLIILLNGGDKGSQARDIAKAKQLAREIDDGIEVDPL